MKSLKLVKGILPVVGAITLISGCSTTNEMYAKYDDICEIPKSKTVERVKIVNKEVPVEKVKYIDRIKVKEVPTVKYVDRIKVKKVPTIKYVDRVKTVKQQIPGVTWEPAVYFEFDKASLTPAELARLDKDLLVLRKKPNLKLSTQAFTDSKGSNKYNRDLALRRQQTVVNYLLSKGLSRNRILMTP